MSRTPVGEGLEMPTTAIAQLAGADTCGLAPLSRLTMSLDERFRNAISQAVAELQSRLDAELAATVADLRADAERQTASAVATAQEATAAAVTEARAQLQSELLTAFESDKTTLAATHQQLLAQAADESRLEVTRLTESAASSLEQARAEAADALSRARAEADATLDAIRQELRDAQGTVLRLRDEHETLVGRLQGEASEAAAAHSQALDSHQSGALRLLEAIRGLDGARSLTDVLDALTRGVAGEAGRAATLVARGDRLVGWRTVGFGALDHDARGIDINTVDGGVVAAAVTTGKPAIVGTGSVLSAPGFSDAPPDRPGLAVPLLVADKPVAVVYADAGTATATAGWTSPVEVLVRHAGRCLEGLAVHRATAARPAAPRVGAPA